MAKEELFIDVTDKGTLRRTTNRTKAADKATRSYLNTAKLLAGAYVAMKAIKIGAEFAQQAAQAQRADKALAAYIGSVDGATRATLAMQDALGGTVSEFQATQLATKLIALNLAKTGDEAADLAGKVAALGSVFGKDATQAIEEFTLLLANNSILRLDTFGISAVTVKERIKELQAATKGLTRDQAFQTATMEQLLIKSELLGDVFDDDASKFDRLQASGADLFEVIGEKLSPVFGFLAENITAAADALTGFLSVQEQGLAMQLVLAEAQLLDLDNQKAIAELNRINAVFRGEEVEAIDENIKRLDFLIGRREADIIVLSATVEGLKAVADGSGEAGAAGARGMNVYSSSLRAASASTRALVADVAGLAAILGLTGLSGLISGFATGAKILGGLDIFGKLGIDLLPSIAPSFAGGGDFVTNGPQLIQVGDNPSGIERVQITPDPVAGGAQGGLTIVLPNDASGVILGAMLRDQIIPGIALIEAEG